MNEDNKPGGLEQRIKHQTDEIRKFAQRPQTLWGSVTNLISQVFWTCVIVGMGIVAWVVQAATVFHKAHPILFWLGAVFLFGALMTLFVRKFRRK